LSLWSEKPNKFGALFVVIQHQFMTNDTVFTDSDWIMDKSGQVNITKEEITLLIRINTCQPQ